MGYKVAVVGATGAVGREILTTLSEREFPADDVVALDKEMPDPSAAVADREGQDPEPPVREPDSGGQEGEPEPGAEHVEPTVARVAVLGQVEAPEIAVAVDRPGHGKVPCNRDQRPLTEPE